MEVGLMKEVRCLNRSWIHDSHHCLGTKYCMPDQRGTLYVEGEMPEKQMSGQNVWIP